MTSPRSASFTFAIIALGASLTCDDAREAPRVRLDVVVDPGLAGPIANDLGYTVTLETARMVVAGVTFTTEGETHAFADFVHALLAPSARAHPGHHAGGEVIGELTGPFVVDWRPGDGTRPTLGVATLLTGEYQGADLALVAGATLHGLAPEDPLVGAGAHLIGKAERAGRNVRFEATLTLPEPPHVAGLPFALIVTSDTRAALGLALATRDPFEGDTLFDGLDFFALAGATDAITLPADAANRLRRAFFSHDHHLVTAHDVLLDPEPP